MDDLIIIGNLVGNLRRRTLCPCVFWTKKSLKPLGVMLMFRYDHLQQKPFSLTACRRALESPAQTPCLIFFLGDWCPHNPNTQTRPPKNHTRIPMEMQKKNEFSGQGRFSPISLSLEAPVERSGAVLSVTPASRSSRSTSAQRSEEVQGENWDATSNENRAGKTQNNN